MRKKTIPFALKAISVFLIVIATSTSVRGDCKVTECGRHPLNDDACMTGYEEISREPCKTRSGTRGKMVYCCPKNSTESLLSTMYGAELNEFPHMAMLSLGGEHHCGATIYNSRYVITAAHCIVNDDGRVKTAAEKMIVKVGRNIGRTVNLKNGYKVEQIVVHKNYTGLLENFVNGKPHAHGLYYDIALLKLNRDIEFGERVKSLPLAPKDFDELKYADKAIIVGWGTTHTFKVSDHLQKTHVVLRTDDTCFNNDHAPWHGYEDSNQLLCVGGHWGGINDPTAGEGDSGGPAICKGPNGFAVLCGVTSFGGGDGEQPDKSCYENGDEAHCQPSVYAEIDHFRRWIVQGAGKQDPSTFFLTKLFGELAPKKRQVYQVHVTSAEGKPCGGTLIRPDTVVTAAQCVSPGDDTSKMYKNITVTTTIKGVEHPVIIVKIHPGFKRFVSKLPGGKYGRNKRMVSSYQPEALEQMTLITDHYHQNDLAVLKLGVPVNINPKMLPRLPNLDEKLASPAYELSFPRNVTYGAGLMQREFNILDKDECQRRMNRMERIGYKTEVDENILCGVENYSGGSTCDRELGGGLICTREDGSEILCGVQIYRLCQWSIPNGFLDVKLHRDFIREVAGIKIKGYLKKVE